MTYGAHSGGPKAAIFAVLGLVACGADPMDGPSTFMGEIGAAGPKVDAGVATDAAPVAPLAERLYREVEPELEKACGARCHGVGVVEGAPAWMKAPAYDTIRSYPGVVVADVYASKLLVKPNHLGLSLLDKSLAQTREKVVKWLTAEAQAASESTAPTSEAFVVKDGANVVDLGTASATVRGATLTFDATFYTVETNRILQLRDIKITAPATAKVKVVHPLLLVVPAEEGALLQRDPTDQFSTVDQTIAAGTTAPLGPGAATLVTFPTNAKLKVRFAKLEPPTQAGPTRACKAVSAFTANAAPALVAAGCPTCHGGANPAAVGAVDMSKLGVDDAAACVQVLAKVNGAKKAESALILAPTSGNALNHGGGKNLAPTSDFVTKILAWAQLE